MEIVWEIQPEKKWKVVWTCSRRCFWKWTSEGFVVNENERSCNIVDIAIPGDIRVSEKEKGKVERY